MKTLAAFLALTLSLSAQARDLGFRYKNGECVDNSGAKGLNPGYIGQCGNLDRTTIANVDFSKQDLSGSSIQSADLQRSSLTGADLTGVNFSGTDLSGVDFNEAKVHGTIFSTAVMVNAHLAGADVKDARFDNVNFSGAVLSYMKFPGSSFAGSNFAGATMDYVEMIGADLQGAILEKTNLHDAVLDRAILDKANLAGTDLHNASLTEVSANGAILKGANLRAAKLNKAMLKTADLRLVQFDSADLSNADLSGSDIRKAVFNGAAVTGANFAQAKYDKKTVLPFSKEEADKFGMVLGGSGKMLVIFDTAGISNNAGVISLKNYFTAQGSEIEFSSQLSDQFTGANMNLDDYSVILHVPSINYSRDMPVAGQKAIVQYVNNGGTYFGTQYVGYMVKAYGYLKELKDLIFIGYDAYKYEVADLKPSSGKENHPLLEGLGKMTKTWYYSESQITSFSVNPAEVILVSGSQSPLLIERQVGAGRALNTTFMPIEFGFFAEPAIQRILLNAAAN